MYNVTKQALSLQQNSGQGGSNNNTGYNINSKATKYGSKTQLAART